MPFTPAHVAAALPFRRSRLIWSALIVGTIAPDLEYYVRLNADGRYGHTLAGTFLVTLPLAFGTLWLFHRFVKEPFVELMPDGLRRRLTVYLGGFGFGGAARFSLIIAPLLVGIVTHLVWDSFTHPNGWPVLHWATLRHRVHMPLIGGVPVYKILQHASTLLGIAILLVWLLAWYRTAEVCSASPGRSQDGWPKRKSLTLLAMAGIAAVGALTRALAGTGIPSSRVAIPRFLGPFVVTLIAIVWWEFVVLGILRSKRRPQETPN
jgi:hypothetical protein